MRTFERNEAYEIWKRCWQDMHDEWFKLEVLQDYSGQDDGPSLRAWLRGDRQRSIALLAQDTSEWKKLCQEKRDAGVTMRRVRIVTKPCSAYTEWELALYKHVNMPGGEQIFIIERQDVSGMPQPAGDVMIFDDRQVAICAYDATGRVIRQTFYDENDDITTFLQLKRNALAQATPLQA